jgi:hypothetical protein
MTTPNPTPEKQNSSAPDSETDPTPANETSPRSNAGFFHRVQQELKPEPMHPSEEKEIVVEMTPIKRTAPDEES